MENEGVFSITIDDTEAKLQPTTSSVTVLQQEKEDLTRKSTDDFDPEQSRDVVVDPEEEERPNEPDPEETSHNDPDQEGIEKQDPGGADPGDPDPLLASIITSNLDVNNENTFTSPPAELLPTELHPAELPVSPTLTSPAELPVSPQQEQASFDQDNSLNGPNMMTPAKQRINLRIEDETCVNTKDTSLESSQALERGQDTSLAMTEITSNYSNNGICSKDTRYFSEEFGGQNSRLHRKPDISSAKYTKKPVSRTLFGSASGGSPHHRNKDPLTSYDKKMYSPDRVELISRHYDACPLRGVPLNGERAESDRASLISQHYDGCGLKNIHLTHDDDMTYRRDNSTPTPDQGRAGRTKAGMRYGSLNTDGRPYGAGSSQRSKPATHFIHKSEGTSFRYVSDTVSYDTPMVTDMIILEDILRQCRAILAKYGKDHNGVSKVARPSLQTDPHRKLEYHQRALAREHSKLDDVEDLLHECRQILTKTGVPVPDAETSALHTNLNLTSKKDETCTRSELESILERDTTHMTTRQLIQYLYTQHPPDIVFQPPHDTILDHNDLYKYLQEAIITYNPLWQKRYDHKWRQQCIHIRDVLIGRYRGLLLESRLEQGLA